MFGDYVFFDITRSFDVGRPIYQNGRLMNPRGTDGKRYWAGTALEYSTYQSAVGGYGSPAGINVGGRPLSSYSQSSSGGYVMNVCSGCGRYAGGLVYGEYGENGILLRMNSLSYEDTYSYFPGYEGQGWTTLPGSSFSGFGHHPYGSGGGTDLNEGSLASTIALVATRTAARTGVGWAAALIEPTPAGEVAMTVVTVGVVAWEVYQLLSKNFKGRRQSQRDQDFGIKDPDFRKWWHRQGKRQNGGRDLTKDEAPGIYDNWVDLGKPLGPK